MFVAFPEKLDFKHENLGLVVNTYYLHRKMVKSNFEFTKNIKNLKWVHNFLYACTAKRFECNSSVVKLNLLQDVIPVRSTSYLI